MSTDLNVFIKEIKFRVLNHEEGFKLDFRSLRYLERGIVNNYHDVYLVVEETWKLAEEQFGKLIKYNLSYEIEKLESQVIKDYIETVFTKHDLLTE